MKSLEEIVHTYNKATSILGEGNYKRAFKLYKDILRVYPCKEAYTNIGNCYRKFGQDTEAIKCYKEALKDSVPFLDPATLTHLHAKNNLALSMFTYGRDQEALQLYSDVMHEKSDFHDALWNMSTAQLRVACSGQPEYFGPGWHNYNSRFVKSGGIQLKNTKQGLRYWDRSTSGDSIIILAEQGIGDNIMFGRYLPLLYKYFQRVYVQCDNTLKLIFDDFNPCFDAAETSASVAYPMCSLASCFDTIPSGSWLKEKFKDSVYDFGSGFNVGIVWSGNPSHANDLYRSTSINRFHGLAKYCNLYSLSPSFKGSKYVKPLAINSWMDTIKYLNGLDLVISVDTSIVHMAGSLGVNTWMLQPYKETDFRWGRMYNSTDCPPTQSNIWYDSVTVFNNPQSWEFVFKNVEECLKSAVKM